jgi:hypothetical protein
MAGISNDYLIYPIMDLVKSSKSDKEYKNFYEGEPSVTLYRDSPIDKDRVTGVKMVFKSDYKIEVILQYGSLDTSSLPIGVDSSSSEYDYYMTERLNSVFISYLDSNNEVIEIYNVVLNYDDEGLLVGTTVSEVSN